MATKPKYHASSNNVRLTKADDPLIEAGMKILIARGLIRPKVADVFRAALAEFVRSGK